MATKQQAGPFQGRTFRRRLSVDKEALTELAKRMGLKHGCPLVTFTDYPKTNFSGRYTGQRVIYGELATHKVTIARGLGVGDANFVLCHELTHALQCDRFGSPKVFGREWLAEMQAVGLTLTEIRHGVAVTSPAYLVTPLEKEANAGADRWFPVCMELGPVITEVER